MEFLLIMKSKTTFRLLQTNFGAKLVCDNISILLKTTSCDLVYRLRIKGPCHESEYDSVFFLTLLPTGYSELVNLNMVVLRFKDTDKISKHVWFIRFSNKKISNFFCYFSYLAFGIAHFMAPCPL